MIDDIIRRKYSLCRGEGSRDLFVVTATTPTRRPEAVPTAPRPSVPWRSVDLVTFSHMLLRPYTSAPLTAKTLNAAPSSMTRGVHLVTCSSKTCSCSSCRTLPHPPTSALSSLSPGRRQQTPHQSPLSRTILLGAYGAFPARLLLLVLHLKRSHRPLKPLSL